MQIPGLGSSPLTRGKLAGRGAVGVGSGLIPAHAGKTSTTCPARLWRWAHPRSRGENQVLRTAGGGVAGSSPLTRGKQVPEAGIHGDPGLIPAHAGKTDHHVGSVRSLRAHPRSRGENAQTTHVISRLGGSSPLTRGKPIQSELRVANGGLIPAHAGKTPSACYGGSSAPAHPRSRGENPIRTRASALVTGSSPLTRGKRCFCPSGTRQGGLIPAHAGKTSSRPPAGAAGRAHPRSRGENFFVHLGVGAVVGSSPLTRGKLADGTVIVAGNGLIPAHAGKTTPASRRSRWRRAHPRSRGENLRETSTRG